MKLSNKELLELSQALKAAMDKDMPYKTALKIGRNAKAVDEKVKVFAEEEQKLIKKYAVKNEAGEPDMDGQQFRIENGREEDFFNDRQTLYDFETDTDLYRLEESELENMEMKPSEVMGLEAIIDMNEGLAI